MHPLRTFGLHTIKDCECPALRIRVPYAEKEVLKGCLKEVKGGLKTKRVSSLMTRAKMCLFPSIEYWNETSFY